MVDVPLFYSLLKALPLHSALLLVGDVDQLPSVGAGQVLKDIISSKVISTVQLTEIFRQAATSNIITNAHRINHGILPNMQITREESDFYFVEAEHGNDIINKIITMVKERIPKKFNLNPVQTENNYDKEVYNGDIGIIKAINEQDQEIIINFYNRDVNYDYTDLDQITLAYATTIHKSQGSEYPAVIIPITMQSYMMLRRNLIYTAITRGKKLVVIIGQKKALAMAVKDTTSSHRYSKLREWLVA